MEIVKVVLSLLLGLFGTWIICLNYSAGYFSKKYKRNVSVVPIVGGVSLSIAFLLSPSPLLRQWFWTPLIFDIGTGMGLVAFCIQTWLERKQC